LEEQNGFTDCESSERFLNNYRKESDSVGFYLKNNGDFGEPVKLTDLHQRYNQFCMEIGCSKLGRKQFAQELRRKGIDYQRQSDGVYYDVHDFAPS
jgi:phage/plasmid-associated DNA primase